MTYNKKLLPHQYDFAFSEDKYPALQGGLGSGKSEAGVLRVLRLMFENPKANFLYAMPTYDLLRLRAIPAFEEFFDAANISYNINKSESIIQADGYGQIIFRSYDNPKRSSPLKCLQQS
jgi:Distinct helicase family with a unique C-terminal domain including a metal-binding cysteine cluster